MRPSTWLGSLSLSKDKRKGHPFKWSTPECVERLARLDNCKNLSDSFQYKSKSPKKEHSLKVKKKSPPGPHPLHIAKKFQNQLEAGSVNKAELARRHGLSRVRVTQIMNLLKLPWEDPTQIVQMPPDEQEFFSEKKAPENCQASICLKAAGGIRSAKIQI